MEQAIEDQEANIKTKARNRFIAFFLSLIIPGLGQIYNGQPKKAAIFFCLLLIIPFLAGMAHVAATFYGLAALFLTEITLRVYIIIDAVKKAKQQQDYSLKPYNTWYHHLLIAIGMLVILSFYDTKAILGLQTFIIPTTSNNPTMQVGDWVIADLKAYDNDQPDYGDIIAFSKADGPIFSYRVVGKPNDEIALIDNIVSINGSLSKASLIGEKINEAKTVAEFEEELPNGHKHLIYKFKQPYNNEKTNVTQTIVPPDSYFLLGDNRDNAADSRYEGFIHKDRIIGRILYSYWGKSATNRINIDFTDK